MRSLFASALIMFLSASAISITVPGGPMGKNVRNNRSDYDLQYPASNYNVSFDTNKIIVEGAAAWNSGKKDDDIVFLPYAKTTLEDWKTKPFAENNIRDG